MNEVSSKPKAILNNAALSSDLAHYMSDFENFVDVAEAFSNLFVSIGKSIQDNMQTTRYESEKEDIEFSFFLTPLAYSEKRTRSLSKTNLHPALIT